MDSQPEPSRYTSCLCVGEGHPSHAYAGTEGRQSYSLNTFPSLVLEGGGWTASCSGCFTSGKDPLTMAVCGTSYGRAIPRIVT
jgi:hypothetical protein